MDGNLLLELDVPFCAGVHRLAHERAAVAVADEDRVRHALEVVALHQDSGVHCGRHAVQLVGAEVVVVDVHRVAEAHPRVALVGAVEPVVVVGDPQVPDVL